MALFTHFVDYVEIMNFDNLAAIEGSVTVFLVVVGGESLCKLHED